MRTFIILLLSCSSLLAAGQDNLKNDDLFYSFSIGAGIGKLPGLEIGEMGIGGMIDFNLKKNKSLATIGYRGIGELQIIGSSSPPITMTSIDILYGRVLSDRKINVSLHTGIGLVWNLDRGNFLYAEPGLFGRVHYEKLRSFTVGLPISSKALISLSEHSALGLEGYVNLNSENICFGLNVCASFENYKFGKKKRVKIE